MVGFLTWLLACAVGPPNASPKAVTPAREVSGTVGRALGDGQVGVAFTDDPHLAWAWRHADPWLASFDPTDPRPIAMERFEPDRVIDVFPAPDGSGAWVEGRDLWYLDAEGQVEAVSWPESAWWGNEPLPVGRGHAWVTTRPRIRRQAVSSNPDFVPGSRVLLLEGAEVHELDLPELYVTSRYTVRSLGSEHAWIGVTNSRAVVSFSWYLATVEPTLTRLPVGEPGCRLDAGTRVRAGGPGIAWSWHPDEPGVCVLRAGGGLDRAWTAPAPVRTVEPAAGDAAWVVDREGTVSLLRGDRAETFLEGEPPRAIFADGGHLWLAIGDRLVALREAGRSVAVREGMTLPDIELARVPSGRGLWLRLDDGLVKVAPDGSRGRRDPIPVSPGVLVRGLRTGSEARHGVLMTTDWGYAFEPATGVQVAIEYGDQVLSPHGTTWTLGRPPALEVHLLRDGRPLPRDDRVGAHLELTLADARGVFATGSGSPDTPVLLHWSHRDAIEGPVALTGFVRDDRGTYVRFSHENLSWKGPLPIPATPEPPPSDHRGGWTSSARPPQSSGDSPVKAMAAQLRSRQPHVPDPGGWPVVEPGPGVMGVPSGPEGILGLDPELPPCAGLHSRVLDIARGARPRHAPADDQGRIAFRVRAAWKVTFPPEVAVGGVLDAREQGVGYVYSLRVRPRDLCRVTAVEGVVTVELPGRVAPR